LAHPAGPGGSGGELPRREVVPRSARPRPEVHASTPPWSPDGLRFLYGDNTYGQSGARIISLRGGAPALVGQISDAGWPPDGSLILGRFWREEMHYVGLATVSPDGEFNPVVLWHPEELKDIFPNSPTWIGT